MDTIEFRSMNSSIQNEAKAAFVNPTQAYTQNGRSNDKSRGGCSNGCGYTRSYDSNRSSDYDKETRSKDYGNGRDRSGCSNGCYSNGYDNGRSNGYDSERSGSYENNRSNGYDNSYENSRSGRNGSGYTRNGHIYYNGCEEIKINEMDDKELVGTGRIMDVAMTLKNVCPCRNVSVGYMVTEMDEQNNEHSRGFKCFTVPAHYNSECCDVEVERTRFILPDDARVDGCTGHCNGNRHFIVRAEAHYADSNVTMP